MSDDPTLDELIPLGGSWSGLLFENPAVGYPPTLSWSFTIDFAEVRRDHGPTTPHLTVDWVPAGSSGWRSMGSQHFRGVSFGDPIEASVYFFEHHRYDRADIRCTDQRSSELEVHIVVTGDIDGLGLPKVEASATVEFAGIYVQTERAGADTGAALEELHQFTDTTGLRPVARSSNVHFVIAE